ncbi:MAG: hypothetical protein HOK58_03490 [Acidimicrobiaceae bacterium]|nr:hypothetical protein [Acidimicrobiaceae bacterium]
MDHTWAKVKDAPLVAASSERIHGIPAFDHQDNGSSRQWINGVGSRSRIIEASIA